jgi:hypothetical protein
LSLRALAGLANISKSKIHSFELAGGGNVPVENVEALKRRLGQAILKT